ncbi:MAG: hypothetical protein AAFR11_07960 [Pseudomonadota bacterium]
MKARGEAKRKTGSSFGRAAAPLLALVMLAGFSAATLVADRTGEVNEHRAGLNLSQTIAALSFWAW